MTPHLFTICTLPILHFLRHHYLAWENLTAGGTKWTPSILSYLTSISFPFPHACLPLPGPSCSCTVPLISLPQLSVSFLWDLCPHSTTLLCLSCLHFPGLPTDGVLPSLLWATSLTTIPFPRRLYCSSPPPLRAMPLASASCMDCCTSDLQSPPPFLTHRLHQPFSPAFCASASHTYSLLFSHLTLLMTLGTQTPLQPAPAEGRKRLYCTTATWTRYHSPLYCKPVFLCGCLSYHFSYFFYRKDTPSVHRGCTFSCWHALLQPLGHLSTHSTLSLHL